MNILQERKKYSETVFLFVVLMYFYPLESTENHSTVLIYFYLHQFFKYSVLNHFSFVKTRCHLFKINSRPS